MTLEKAIYRIAEVMPEGWRCRIDVEHGSASVVCIPPDGSEVDMSDGENDFTEQVLAALRLAETEQPNAKLSGPDQGGAA